MKKLFMFAVAVTLSTSVLAGNMSDNKGMEAMHSKMADKQSLEKVIQNEDMQRLHKEMTRNAVSEPGMEARLQMITTEEGRAYHEAIKKEENNT